MGLGQWARCFRGPSVVLLDLYSMGMLVSQEWNLLISFLQSLYLTVNVLRIPQSEKTGGFLVVIEYTFHLKVCFQYTASYLFTDFPDILRPSFRFRECASSFWLFHLVGRGVFAWLCVCGFCLFICFAGDGNNIEAFNSFLLRFFNQTSFLLHPSYSKVPRAYKF